jgi:organic radical activating enzyme
MKIEIMPTLKCNLSCLGCDRGDSAGPFKDVEDLNDFSIITSIYEKIQNDTEVKFFVVSGGEPLLYPRFSELIEFLNNLHDSPVEIKTNGKNLEKIDENLLKNNHWSVSIYKENTSEALDQMMKFSQLIKRGNINFNKIKSFEKLTDFEKEISSGLNPLNYCFMPTLIGNLPRVFPCCRAYTYERMRGRENEFSLDLDNFSISNLESKITSTDLCENCPRLYKTKEVNF